MRVMDVYDVAGALASHLSIITVAWAVMRLTGWPRYW